MLNFGNKEFRNLQEQVLKNAQDIETLKGREDLQIVIVNELPEVGNPNYIYLVAKDDGESPDVYDEYIWLEDEERYEKIGGVSIDLTNYVTLDSEQTITGEKTFTHQIFLKSPNASYLSQLGCEDNGALYITHRNNQLMRFDANNVYAKNFYCWGNGNYDLGGSSNPWKDLYISGNILFNPTATYYGKITVETQGIKMGTNVQDCLKFSGYNMYAVTSLIPNDNNVQSLGSSSNYWKNLYLAGNVSDGVNTFTVANIASKATSTFISGTFDSNGESTIDISGGTPEGLFIFTYGNCQCFVRLTATMVQNADAVPINVSCPMIYNNTVSLGWLSISRSSDTLTITVTDQNHHVDSGYAWTLTKTNLI